MKEECSIESSENDALSNRSENLSDGGKVTLKAPNS